MECEYDPAQFSFGLFCVVAAEYLARGYKLSDQILERAIALDNEKGISKKFLDYMQSMNTTLGEKALGKDQTISGKVQETFTQATAHAKALDEQRGISKHAGEVSVSLVARCVVSG